MTPIQEIATAASSGDVARLRELLASDGSLARAFDDEGWTALHLAAFHGHRDAAEALLESGAMVDARSTNRLENTPLHAACAGGRTELVALLLAHHADPDAREHGGYTALHLAVDHDDLAMVTLLLDAGAFLGPHDEDGVTPLAMATRDQHDTVAELLRTRGAVE